MGIVLTNAARFSPYTFDEMLKPLAMATQEQRAIEEGISELGSKADLMRMYANEEPNSKVASMYNTYANDLDKQAEALAKSGLNPASRKGLLDLKRRYSSEITPIETAVTRRRQLAEEQRKAILANPSLMYDRYFSNASLQDIMDNPEISYTPVSGNELYAKGAAAAKATSLRRLTHDQIQALGDQYWQLTKRQGYSAQEAANWLAGKLNIPELSDAIKRIKAEAGTDILGKTDQKRAENYIIDGIMSELTYNETRDYKGNQDYEYKMRNWLNEEEHNRRMKEKNTSGKGQGNNDNTKKGLSTAQLEIGAEGKVSQDVLRLEGLRDTGNGTYSTTALDRLNIPYQKAKNDFETEGKELEAVYNKYLSDLASWNQRAEENPKLKSHRAAETIGDPKPEKTKEVWRYEELKANLDKAEANLRKEFAEVQKIVSKYNHLGNTPYERVHKGMLLEKVQQLQQNNPITIYEENTDYNKIRERITSMYSGFTEDDVKGEAGLYENGKKALNWKEGNEVLSSKDAPISFRIAMGESPRLEIIGGGKSYDFRGSRAIREINETLGEVNSFLKDFINIHKNPKQPVSKIQSNGIIDFKPFKLGNTNYYGSIDWDPNTSNYTKHLYYINSDGVLVPVSSNTVEDEISGGAVRSSTLESIAQMALESL